MTNLEKEQIDNYHAGKMNDAEMAEFESQLDADPTLKAESDFQADIVSGLKEYRKKGVGSAILEKLIDSISAGMEIYVHVQLYNIDFFKKRGFEVDSEEFEEAGIPHVRMMYREGVN